jgi:choline dehydrogenase-like flavoprotein
LPGFEPAQPTYELSGSDSFFIPCFCNLAQQQERFLRGYGIWGGVQRFEVPAIVRKVGNGVIGFLIGHGEVLPRYQNHVRLNPRVVDAWGIPAAHIDCARTENEQQMIEHMRSQIQALVHRAGGDCVRLADLAHIPLFSGYVRKVEETMDYAAPPGYYIHEVGGACMGTTPTNSVLNANNQCWDAPNLLVTDGACWTTSAWQSPTLTEMAITARACDLIATALQTGAL